MPEIAVTVKNDLGLHARPAARLAAVARAFNADIKLRANGREADAKSVAALLMLAAAQGTEAKLSADGPDADNALRALAELFNAGFNDPAQ